MVLTEQAQSSVSLNEPQKTTVVEKPEWRI